MIVRKRVNGKYEKYDAGEIDAFGAILYGEAKNLWDNATDDQKVDIHSLLEELYVGYEIPTCGAVNSIVVSSWAMFDDDAQSANY